MTVPAVFVARGPLLMIRGPGALRLRALLRGKTPDAGDEELLRAIDAAVAEYMLETDRGDGSADGTGPEPYDAIIGTVDAARILGFSESYLRRNAERFGGTRSRPGASWSFDRAAVEALARRRAS